MSSGARKIDRLKEVFDGTNWATSHLAMQGPMHVAKATELAFEGKPRPELLSGDDEATRKVARCKMNAWDVANSSGLQAIPANTATSHSSHV